MSLSLLPYLLFTFPSRLTFLLQYLNFPVSPVYLFVCGTEARAPPLHCPEIPQWLIFIPPLLQLLHCTLSMLAPTGSFLRISTAFTFIPPDEEKEKSSHSSCLSVAHDLYLMTCFHPLTTHAHIHIHTHFRPCIRRYTNKNNLDYFSLINPIHLCNSNR